MKRDLISLMDLKPREILALLDRAAVLKKLRARKRLTQSLRGKSLGLIFEKPSTRTKVSFDIAMYELGGHTVNLDATSSQLGRGESYEDTARVMSRFVHGIVMRTFSQANLNRMARVATVPVINGLSDQHHPCQVFADLMTIQEHKSRKLKLNICYVGDGNNMANSWIMAAVLLKFPLAVATPKGFEPSKEVLKIIDSGKCANIVVTQDPVEAVRKADVVNTDTWFSMGQKVSDEKRRLFEPFRVDRELLRHASPGAIVLHCLPAHRGEEITEDVIDGPQSRVWDQAENRLHVQKAILEMLLR